MTGVDGVAELGPGDRIGPIEIGPVAHGGHCVARHEGRVVFVRHGLPGELVTVRLTDSGHASYWRGDVVEVHRASADRVPAPCPISGPGLCGGCDFQHVDPVHQRELKRHVVAEQLARLAKLDWDGVVEAVPTDGTAWRTRMRWFGTGDTVGDGSLWGLRGHRSHQVIPLPSQGCLISLVDPPDRAGTDADVVRDADGRQTMVIDGELVAGDHEIEQRADGRTYRVAAQGFWQVHPAAADTLVAAVVDGLAPRPGERAFDLYCGVGLFAGALADRDVRVLGVEGDRRAVAMARGNVPGAQFRVGDVARVVRTLPKRTDLVVLDPPRKGAGRVVMDAVLARKPRRVAYVACDPAALARDLGTATRAGWRVVSIRAFDLFPMTHHVECVAILSPPGEG